MTTAGASRVLPWIDESGGRGEFTEHDLIGFGGSVDLIFDTGSYFETPDGYVELPLGRLILSRARPTGVANAVLYMKLALSGQYPRRKPISVVPFEDDFFRVLDGNSTVVNAWLSCWPTVPVTIENVAGAP